MSMPLFDRVGEAGDGESERGGPRVWRVAELNRQARALVEGGFGPATWVEGELSNVRRRGGGGHVYFTLNDGQDGASLTGVMFQADARRARARLEDGQAVRLQGRLTIYEARGQYQLVARVALPAGRGDRQAQLERLKRKLAGEGLFAVERKRALPMAPRVLGVVTSLSGAALGDIVRVAERRCPLRIVVADCRVQGPDAPASVRAALEAIQRVPDLDVVVLGRGGGAAEDLWPFDDEALVRAVAACRVPIVTAVGHEQDVTLVDLAADARAATPSHAAELVVSERDALKRRLEAHARSLAHEMRRRIEAERRAIGAVRLADPRRATAVRRNALAEGRASLERAAVRGVGLRRRSWDALREALRRHEPRARLARDRSDLRALCARLAVEGRRVVAGGRTTLERLGHEARSAGGPTLERHRARHASLVDRLDAMSPLRVLARGYSVALHADSGRALVDAEAVGVGDVVQLRLHRGRVDARVEAVHPDAPDGLGGGPGSPD